ncbi:MAG: protein-disulfide reductase DsbD family protein, partial [Planctomycetales bacterium]
MKHLFAFLFSLAALVNYAGAQFDPFAADEGSSKTRASLVSQQKIIAPGEPFTVAMKLEIPNNWHSYFINPGLIGEPITFQWELPEGFSAGEIQWQTPHIAQMLGMNTYGYSHTVYYPVTITPPTTLPIGKDIQLKLKAKWQICDDNNCIYEPANGAFGDYSVTVSTGDKSDINDTTADDFASANKHLPIASNDWAFTSSDNDG